MHLVQCASDLFPSAWRVLCFTSAVVFISPIPMVLEDINIKLAVSVSVRDASLPSSETAEWMWLKFTLDAGLSRTLRLAFW